MVETAAPYLPIGARSTAPEQASCVVRSRWAAQLRRWRDGNADGSVCLWSG
jgi:hypothetical protein